MFENPVKPAFEAFRKFEEIRQTISFLTGPRELPSPIERARRQI